MKRTDIVIVGGSSGIGLALAQKLAAAEYSVTNISRTACPVAGVKNYIADASSPQELGKAFAKISTIDALVYCAGTSLAAPLEYVEYADVKNLFDVNVIGAIECCKLAMKKLKTSGSGKIILLGSVGGIAPIAFDSFYSASKAALILFARAVNLETDSVKTTVAVIGGTRTRFSFKRKIYADCGKYNGKLKSASDSLIKIEQQGYSADYVANKLAKMLKGNTPAVVTIGFKYKLASLCYKLLPQRLKQFADKKVYGL